MEKNKGSNFTAAETTALLEGARANRRALFGAAGGPGQSSLSSKLKNKIWADITKQVNATGSGPRRNVEQVRLRWKNLKQRATKDHSEATKNQRGNNAIKRGEFTETVLDIIGGESSRVGFGIPPAGTGESIDPTKPLNLSAGMTPLTPLTPEEGASEEPCTSRSPVLEEMGNPPAPPCKRRRQAEEGDACSNFTASRPSTLWSGVKQRRLKSEEVRVRPESLLSPARVGDVTWGRDGDRGIGTDGATGGGWWDRLGVALTGTLIGWALGLGPRNAGSEGFGHGETKEPEGGK
ncbi:hypothetical protein EYF80_031778 [Liparis tanakae]|uniref:Myb-like domain-containing protein n=1 Tax=Liparis tanakae TaxID=230148 RepID=A0A4Z2GXP7_9TELE|nr:hypothetical protein EYF80_031778 [Liparis tanakae]